MRAFDILKNGTSISKREKNIQVSGSIESNNQALTTQNKLLQDKLNKLELKEGQIVSQIARCQEMIKASKGNKRLAKLETIYTYLFSKKEEIGREKIGVIGVKREGESSLQPIPHFSQMQIEEYLISALKEEGIVYPTPIQMQGIPLFMQGRDIIGCSPTGTGKTMAFLLPLLSLAAINARETLNNHLTTLVVAPTRELALQLYKEFLVLASKAPRCISKSAGKTVKFLHKASLPKSRREGSELECSTQILISTPSTLWKLISSNYLPDGVRNIKHIVIDEADKLFELELIDYIDRIITAVGERDKLQKQPQKAIYTATLQPNIEQLVRTILISPVKLLIGKKNTVVETVKQRLVYVGAQEHGKLAALRDIFAHGFKPPILIFLQSKQRAKELFWELKYDPIKVGIIHADMTKHHRDLVVLQFRTGKIWVLICSELMSRGIDFKGVSLVVNYDFPQTIVSYIHRVGRTGRAGNTGEAISFYTDQDINALPSIANLLNNSGGHVEDWMLQLPKCPKERKKQLEKFPVKRGKITTKVGSHVDKGFNKKVTKLDRKNTKIVLREKQKILKLQKLAHEMGSVKANLESEDLGQAEFNS